MVGIASAAIYSVLVPISEATTLTLDDLNAGTGYMFLGEIFRVDLYTCDNCMLIWSSFWMGLLVLATTGFAVWKASRLPFEYSGHYGNSSLGALYEEQWAVDREQDLAYASIISL